MPTPLLAFARERGHGHESIATRMRAMWQKRAERALEKLGRAAR